MSQRIKYVDGVAVPLSEAENAERDLEEAQWAARAAQPAPSRAAQLVADILADPAALALLKAELVKG